MDLYLLYDIITIKRMEESLMEKNKSLLFGVLGSFALALIKTPIYQKAGMAFAKSAMIGGDTHISFIKFISNFFLSQALFLQ